MRMHVDGLVVDGDMERPALATLWLRGGFLHIFTRTYTYTYVVVGKIKELSCKKNERLILETDMYSARARDCSQEKEETRVRTWSTTERPCKKKKKKRNERPSEAGGLMSAPQDSD
jgi:hypothetical protein